MAVRRAPTSAGTARTPCRARNAGQQPVRRDAHRRRRLPAMPSQAPGKRSLIGRRRSGWAACSKRHSPPGYRPLAKVRRRGWRRGRAGSRSPGWKDPVAPAEQSAVFLTGELRGRCSRVPPPSPATPRGQLASGSFRKDSDVHVGPSIVRDCDLVACLAYTTSECELKLTGAK